jgi:RsiW-degrading membrane proteinase PrsW (M82 family)
MNELIVVNGGRRIVLQPTQVAMIGRSTSNDVDVNDPRVSREHVRLSWGATGWVLENVGRGGTYVAGQPVTHCSVNRPMEARLAAVDGPAVRFEPWVEPAMPNGAAMPNGIANAQALTPGAMAAVDNLKTALGILVPVKSWLKNPGWRQTLRLLVIPYALLPLSFIALYANSGNLTTPGWAYSLYVAPLWLIAFWFLIRPGRIGWREVQISIAVMAWVLVWIKAVTIGINGHFGAPPLSFLNALGVGFNEEITKALPVLVIALVLLHVRGVKLSVRKWMFIGTVAGLTFGVFESSTLYTVEAILGIHSAQANNQAIGQILSFADRVFVDGFQHAVWAGISAFFIGMAVNYKRRRVELIVFGVTLAALLHGVNDWIAPVFGSLWSQVIVDAVSLVLFLGYTMSAETIEKEVRVTPLFRGQSIYLDPSQQAESAVSSSSSLGSLGT